MPENEFEKKVSSEMQELKFAPSEKVWLHVEERIRKKNKRRVFVIIFLLAGLSLLGYWQRDNLFGEKKNDIVKTEKQEESNSKPLEEEATINSATTTQHTTTPEENEINDVKTSNKKDENTNNKTVTEKLVTEIPSVRKNNIDIPGNKISPAAKKDRNVSAPLKNDNENQPAPPVTTAVTDVNAKISGKKDTVVNGPDEVVDKKQTDIKQPERKPADNNPDSVKSGIIQPKKNSIDIKDSASKKRSLKDSAAVVQKKPGAKKWKWGLQFTPGISSLHEHSFSLSEKRFADVNYQSPSTGAGMPARRRPSEVRSGFAFQAGGFAQTKISSRISFSIGFQYAYYSSHLDVGNRRDSLLSLQFSSFLDANSVYNAGSDTTTYTNHYHFIELPLHVQWQLNKNKTKPFVWSAGFSIGQLITSNAIMYDTAFGGIYYKNKNLLNKTQFSLSTGFSWTVANNKRMQWIVGPFADIHLNKLVTNPFEDKKYLHFIGMRTAMIVNQKK